MNVFNRYLSLSNGIFKGDLMKTFASDMDVTLDNLILAGTSGRVFALSGLAQALILAIVTSENSR